MAIVQTPTIRTVISGDGITALDKSTTFTLLEKLETTRQLIDTEGDVEIDFSYIDKVKSFYFESTGVFTVTIEHTSDDLIPVVSTIPFEVDGGVFRFDPTAAMQTAITGLTLSTSSTTAISVNIRIYGVAST